MKKILVAYDGGQPARRALELAAELAHPFGAQVGVVSVIPVHPGRAPIDPWDDRTVHAAELEDARTLLAGQGIAAALYEPAGEPGPAIGQIAEEGGYDMIVLGSRGLGMLSRVLQGSVSEHVATHAHATVVVAR